MRNALGGKAGGNSYGKTYDFHDVTIVFTGLTVTLKLHCCMNFLESMCTSRELLCCTYANLSMGGRFGNISAGFVRQNVRRSLTSMLPRKNGRRGSHFHFLVIIGEQMQSVHFVEQMQIVKFLIFPDWSIGQYRKI